MIMVLLLLLICFLGTLLPLTSGFQENLGYRLFYTISQVIAYSILLLQIKSYRSNSSSILLGLVCGFAVTYRRTLKNLPASIH